MTASCGQVREHRIFPERKSGTESKDEVEPGPLTAESTSNSQVGSENLAMKYEKK
jgi:hypothetical protein